MSEVILFIFWVVVACACAGVYIVVGLLISSTKDNEDKTGAELRNIVLFWPWFVLVDLFWFVVKHIKIEVAKWK